jgi:hypothetical protein
VAAWRPARSPAPAATPAPARLVVDDVADTRPAALDRDGGRRRGVFDVDERRDATTADDREPPLAR